MPILVIVSVALQIACGVHVVRSGRQLYWLWILFIGSYLAVAVYVLVAVIPDLRNDPRSRRAARSMLHTLDPQRRKREIQQQLEIADTIENRRALAEESMRLGDYANAAELYRSVLIGVYKDDAAFLLGLARAQAGLEDFPAARATLDTLFTAHRISATTTRNCCARACSKRTGSSTPRSTTTANCRPAIRAKKRATLKCSPCSRRRARTQHSWQR